MTTEQKASFYNVMAKVLRYSAIVLGGAGIVAGIILIPTVTAAVGLATAFAGMVFGSACYISSNISQVYADGYKAEVELDGKQDNVKVEDFKLEKENTNANINTYTANQNVNTKEDELTK